MTRVGGPNWSVKLTEEDLASTHRLYSVAFEANSNHFAITTYVMDFTSPQSSQSAHFFEMTSFIAIFTKSSDFSLANTFFP